MRLRLPAASGVSPVAWPNIVAIVRVELAIHPYPDWLLRTSEGGSLPGRPQV